MMRGVARRVRSSCIRIHTRVTLKILYTYAYILYVTYIYMRIYMKSERNGESRDGGERSKGGSLARARG